MNRAHLLYALGSPQPASRCARWYTVQSAMAATVWLANVHSATNAAAAYTLASPTHTPKTRTPNRRRGRSTTKQTALNAYATGCSHAMHASDALAVCMSQCRPGCVSWCRPGAVRQHKQHWQCEARTAVQQGQVTCNLIAGGCLHIMSVPGQQHRVCHAGSQPDRHHAL